ncbi:hypothetical protein DESC_780309 [Desulfosarcina cetonica]|nr:hypothetical protein DESC_780309 [Desulfosarcina cetonica]
MPPTRHVRDFGQAAIQRQGNWDKIKNDELVKSSLPRLTEANLVT